jgi:type IV pilus assembly protein PilA
MQTSLKANLLKHLIAKKEEGGFTLIELLVVIIIIGILAAIALPSFLNQANRARQSEAQTYVGSMNRAQQAYYLERTQFSGNLGALGLGIPETTQYYRYEAAPGGGGGAPVRVTNRAITVDQAGAVFTDSPVLSFLGGVSVGEVVTDTTAGADPEAPNQVRETTTIAKMCRGERAPVNNGPTGNEVVIDVGTSDDGASVNEPQCPDQYEDI